MDLEIKSRELVLNPTVIPAKAGIQCMRERPTTIMFSERDILAVCFGLRQKFSKDSFYLENF